MIPTLHIHHLLGEFRLLWPDPTEAQAQPNLGILVGRLRPACPALTPSPTSKEP